MNLTKTLISTISHFNGITSRSLNVFRFISYSSLPVSSGEPCFGNVKRLTVLNFKRNLVQGSTVFKSAALQPKKRLIKKKKPQEVDEKGSRVIAYSTAEEYNLESLTIALPELSQFKPTAFNLEFRNVLDVVHAEKNLGEHLGSQHLFFFREGCVVMWNLTDPEAETILNILKGFEDSSFSDDVIRQEREVMTYSYSSDTRGTGIISDSVKFCMNGDILLEKYAVSNAMALSVHLGTYEANLDKYIETMEPVTEDLKLGESIKMSREEVLRKTGQLFALRHNINLNSDLLDTPDFYWDREELEKLYQITFNYFCIQKRTRVMNERLNHCIELVELLSSHLNDKHHVRLEWMIIALIMVEVAFEILHYTERFLDSQENQSVPSLL